MYMLALLTMRLEELLSQKKTDLHCTHTYNMVIEYTVRRFLNLREIRERMIGCRAPPCIILWGERVLWVFSDIYLIHT